MRRLLTRHALARFTERFPNSKSTAEQALAWAEEDKSMLNDVHLANYLGVRYGFEKRFRFYVHGNIIFVGTEKTSAGSEQAVSIVTVYSTQSAQAFNSERRERMRAIPDHCRSQGVAADTARRRLAEKFASLLPAPAALAA